MDEPTAIQAGGRGHPFSPRGPPFCVRGPRFWTSGQQKDRAGPPLAHPAQWTRGAGTVDKPLLTVDNAVESLDKPVFQPDKRVFGVDTLFASGDLALRIRTLSVEKPPP